jgi:hypothetical protein
MNTTNPYQPPTLPPGEPQPKRPNTRFRILLDSYAVVAAALPIPLHCGVLMNIHQATDIQDFMFFYFGVLLALWVPSLLINITGVFTLRPLSFLGLVLNGLSAFVVMNLVSGLTKTL